MLNPSVTLWYRTVAKGLFSSPVSLALSLSLTLKFYVCELVIA